ncbi:unnamed protein product [Symbiodinium natans]|uniref:Uncharacterized protein n=1 Tax=Symbiodinium natans TaxID=878477 RepID=A0A812UND7_9DINO|nr:unnamed protein product [Symbiodinium natans]
MLGYSTADAKAARAKAARAKAAKAKAAKAKARRDTRHCDSIERASFALPTRAPAALPGMPTLQVWRRELRGLCMDLAELGIGQGQRTARDTARRGAREARRGSGVQAMGPWSGPGAALSTAP